VLWQFEVLDNMSKRVSIAIYQEGYLSKRKNGYILKNIDPMNQKIGGTAW